MGNSQQILTKNENLNKKQQKIGAQQQKKSDKSSQASISESKKTDKNENRAVIPDLQQTQRQVISNGSQAEGKDRSKPDINLINRQLIQLKQADQELVQNLNTTNELLCSFSSKTKDRSPSFSANKNLKFEMNLGKVDNDSMFEGSQRTAYFVQVSGNSKEIKSIRTLGGPQLSQSCQQSSSHQQQYDDSDDDLEIDKNTEKQFSCIDERIDSDFSEIYEESTLEIIPRDFESRVSIVYFNEEDLV